MTCASRLKDIDSAAFSVTDTLISCRSVIVQLSCLAMQGK